MSTLKNLVKDQNTENSFFSALNYAISFSINKETEYFKDEVLKNKIGVDLYQKLELKNKCVFLT